MVVSGRVDGGYQLGAHGQPTRDCGTSPRACHMAVAGRRIRARDGRVYARAAGQYQALVDAADAAPFAPDLLREIVDHLRQHLEADEPGVDLDEFLAAYDARHGDAG